MFKKFEIVKNVCVLNVCLVIYSCKIYKLNVQLMYYCFRLIKIFIIFIDYKKKYKYGLYNIFLNFSIKIEKVINL